MDEVRRFLIKNGFEIIEDNSYKNDKCSIFFEQTGYAVANSQGLTMYSPDFEIYWLIGVLTYYDYIKKNYVI